mgnify:CR=1 FL=1
MTDKKIPFSDELIPFAAGRSDHVEPAFFDADS